MTLNHRWVASFQVTLYLLSKKPTSGSCLTKGDTLGLRVRSPWVHISVWLLRGWVTLDSLSL